LSGRGFLFYPPLDDMSFTGLHAVDRIKKSICAQVNVALAVGVALMTLFEAGWGKKLTTEVAHGRVRNNLNPIA
jgi:hypothetical protein